MPAPSDQPTSPGLSRRELLVIGGSAALAAGVGAALGSWSQPLPLPIGDRGADEAAVRVSWEHERELVARYDALLRTGELPATAGRADLQRIRDDHSLHERSLAALLGPQAVPTGEPIPVPPTQSGERLLRLENEMASRHRVAARISAAPGTVELFALMYAGEVSHVQWWRART